MSHTEDVPNAKFITKVDLPLNGTKHLEIDKHQNNPKNSGDIRPKNYYSHLSKSLLKKNQLPSFFIFYPTSRCNMTCSHCFYHDSLNKKFNELTLEEIDKFTKTMDPLLQLVITGGEPYIRDDIDKIVKIFYDNTNVPNISIPSS